MEYIDLVGNIDPYIASKLEEYKNDGKVFRSVGECIVILEKIQNTTTNEDREGIIDREYATYNASRLHIIDIIDKCGMEADGEPISYNHCKYHTDVYNVGDILSDDKGIRYYMSYIPAYYEHSGNIDQGDGEGLWIEWHPNGRMEELSHYVDNTMLGKYTKWHFNGNKKEEGNFVDYCVEDGIKKEWYVDGSIKQESEYVDGKCVRDTEWLSDGQMVSNITYKNDVCDGVMERWYNDGTKWSHYEHKEGKKHGKHLSWDTDGNIRRSTVYKDDKVDGVLEMWHKKSLMVHVEYKNGVKHGTYIVWKSDGTIRKEEEYIDGELIDN
jgi:antitoxin component YwqK of YwqJK toxin-antitoxin module